MTTTTLVRDLLDLPKHTGKSDFVVKLTDGLSKAEQTVRDYVVTPSLRGAFDDALRTIGQALEDGASRAAYLHGSFGSGKSHFMAMLGLLLEDHPAAWSHRDLQDLKPKAPWIGTRKLIRLACHMLGAESLRDQVFSTYLEYLDENHPDAPLPAVFADQQLFENAESLRGKMSDEPFFRALNEGLSDGDQSGAWGTFGSAARWDADRFDEARHSADSTKRAELTDRLVATLFESFRSERRYVDFDRGLEAICAHAKALGYDGVLMLLDELILWLAGRIAQRDVITREVEHIVKLVEAQSMDRAVPIVSFIARQRNLSDLVGERNLGEDTLNLQHQLEHNSGRLSTILLEERNLPAIVSQRLLRPKDAEAAELIDRTFRKVSDQVARHLQTLFGQHGNIETFRALYPFSPALIDALVAISDCLQRERTALKMLADMLVEHLRDLELGKVVPVGDLFDLVAAGDPIDEPMLRSKFDRAKGIYEDRILPMLRAMHGTESASACQRLREDHKVSLGCANCEQTACRNANRLVKTLLLADMVPNLEAFRDLTVSKLVGLNHGAITSSIPGREASIAATQVRSWVESIPELRIGDEDDPRVHISLESVDLEPILRAAANVDTDGARRRVVKEILLESLGFDTSADEAERTVTWRGTKRTCRLLYANVRELGPQRFQASEAEDLRLILDYPFDEQGHAPDEDVRKVEDWSNAHPDGSPTIVWLPSFFSTGVQEALGRHLQTTHVLRNKGQYLANLREEDQIRAEQLLDNVKSQTRVRIKEALAKVYGLRTLAQDDKDIDPTRRLDKHLYCLLPDREFQGLVQTDFEPALADLASRLLNWRFPRHPNLGDSTAVTVGKLEKVKKAFAEAREAPNQTIPVQSHPARTEVVRIGVPLELFEETRSGVKLRTSRLDALERTRAQRNSHTPTVGDLRKMLDQDGQAGLPAVVEDLVILCYAEQFDREARQLGQPFEPTIGKLDNAVELHAQPLPSEPEWQRALQLAGAVCGYTRGKTLLSAANVREFVAELRNVLRTHQAAVLENPALLESWLDDLGAPRSGARLTAAREAAEVVDIVSVGEPLEVVRALAALEFESSRAAVASAVGASETQRRALKNELSLKALMSANSAVREQAIQALTCDEVAVRLEPELKKLAGAAMQKAPPKAARTPGAERVVDAANESATRDEVRRALRDAGDRLDRLPDDGRFSFSIRIDKDGTA